MSVKGKHRIEKTGCYSYRLGTLAKGCRHCVKGEKLVLFVTGICPRNCSYCPISDQKHQNDITFANEWPTSRVKDIIEEAKLCSAKGAGFTGGDPLARLDRTVNYIRVLKKEFGKEFHIHLYTSFDLVNTKTLKHLHDAGLDEIRFHADIDDDALWYAIDTAGLFKWDIGIEIPVIPGKKAKIKRMMKFMEGKINFMNLNELEVSDAKANRLAEAGHRTKNNLSYGVKGSEKLAKELLEFAKDDISYSIHYCTAKLKDKVQLAKRIKRRAKNTARAFDLIDMDGNLVRGAVYLKNTTPAFDYSARLEKITPAKRRSAVNMLKNIAKKISKEHRVPRDIMEIDEKRLRLITNVGVVQHLADAIREMGAVPAIVTEYPTWDALIIELDLL